ncbi:MAG: hypothetical protein BWX48_03439 [Verrucomicrobia bacterium ADurb.Bin006]|nr:MAG: hypothetical protein BWX48_03439 [Verrucomicrobia bacterium ADurb.Bin006]
MVPVRIQPLNVNACHEPRGVRLPALVALVGTGERLFPLLRFTGR